jgi:hypothetical protein
MIKALPLSGAHVITHSASSRNKIEKLIHELRGPEVAEFCAVTAVTSAVSAKQALSDEWRPIVFEHDFYLYAPLAVIRLAEHLARVRQR